MSTPRALSLACTLLAVSGSTAAGATYRVHNGDTLTAIAAAHHTTVGRLEQINHLPTSGVILTGTVLRLPAPPVTLVHYTVQAGDSLSAIAGRFHTTVSALVRRNRIRTPNTVWVGAVLLVPSHGSVVAGQTASSTAPAPPATTTYRVQPGDTLSGIAMRYGTNIATLTHLNDLSLDRPLFANAVLRVPETQATSSADASSVRESMIYWADHYGVDPRLVEAVGWMESGFNNSMVSSVGAMGIMQITPDTWTYVEQVLLLGAPVPDTPDGNVRIGVALLHHLLDRYSGDARRALAAYYQGTASLDTLGFVPGTSQYVDDILALRARF